MVKCYRIEYTTLADPDTKQEFYCEAINPKSAKRGLKLFCKMKKIKLKEHFTPEVMDKVIHNYES